MLRYNSNKRKRPLSKKPQKHNDKGRSENCVSSSHRLVVNKCCWHNVLSGLKHTWAFRRVERTGVVLFIIALWEGFLHIEAFQRSLYRPTRQSSLIITSASYFPNGGGRVLSKHQLSMSKYLLQQDTDVFATVKCSTTSSLAGYVAQTPCMFLSPANRHDLKILKSPYEKYTSTFFSLDDPERDSILPAASILQKKQNHQRKRGVLGFQVDSGENSSLQPMNPERTRFLRRSLSSRVGLNLLFGHGPSNLDFSSWNWPEPLSLDTDTSVDVTGSTLVDTDTRLDGVLWSPDSTQWPIADVDIHPYNISESLLRDDSTMGLPYIPTVPQIQSLTISQLKDELGIRGLRKSGNKALLQERLIAWTEEQGTSVFKEKGELRNSPCSPDVAYDSTKFSTGHSEAVDLEPLLQRRANIRKEKMEGKKVDRPELVPIISSSSPLPENCRESLRKAFEKPSSVYSNIDVKRLYAASKQADQNGNRGLSKQLLLELKSNATPKDPRLFRRLARMEQEDGNTERAIEILNEGLDLNPNNAYLLHGLGQIFNKAGDSERARYYFTKAIDSDPTLPNSYHALGTMEHTLGRVAKATKILKKGIEYCPSNHRLHHAIGDVYREAKLLEMASKSYHKSLSTGPKVSCGFAYTALAYVAYEQDDISQCRSWLQRAAKENDGRQSNAWVSWSQFEESEGNIERARAVCLAAIAQYERVLLEKLSSSQTNNQFRPQKFELTPKLMDKGLLRSKLRNSSLIYRSGDRFYNVYRTWTRLEERYGTQESTNDAFERASILFPQSWKISLDWARYCQKQGSRDRARFLFAESCRKASSYNRHADPFRLYAEFEASQGCYEKAIEILSSGVSSLVSPGRRKDNGSPRVAGIAELLYSWAVCEWHLGRHARAKVVFQHLLKIAAIDEAHMRAFVLLAMAKLEAEMLEYHRAQHYICLCLKENNKGTFGAQAWRFWADLAILMGNGRLALHCEKYSVIAEKEGEENLLTGAADLVALNLMAESSSRTDSQQLLRREPWQSKIFGSSEQQRQASSFYRNCLQLPEKKTVPANVNSQIESVLK